MTIGEMVNYEKFQTITGEVGCTNQVSGVYVGDLLSWVMGNAKEGDLWVTIQGHLNIVAVAQLTGVSGIVVAEGASVEPETIQKAIQEDVPILTTKLSAFQVCALLSPEFSIASN